MNLQTIVACCTAILLPSLATGCRPQTSDPHKYADVQEQNAKLRSEVSRMEALIRQAGEDTPDLADQIAKREQEVAAAYEELSELTKRETELKVQEINLQGRLESFQHTFQQMQKDLTNATKR